MFGKLIRLILFIFSGVTALSVTIQAGENIPVPEGVLYHRFASSCISSEASWINPAAFGLYENLSIQFMSEIYDGRLSESWGMNLTGDGAGLTYRNFYDTSNNHFIEYIFSGGRKLNNHVYMGVSYRYLKSDLDKYNKRGYWNLGILINPGLKFSYAACFTNLNRGRLDGVRTNFEQLYSITYSATEIIHASVEMRLASDQSISSALYNYGVDILPVKGLYIYANFLSKDGFEFGFRVNLNQYFVGFQPRYGVDNQHTGSSIFAGYVAGQQPSIIKNKK